MNRSGDRYKHCHVLMEKFRWWINQCLLYSFQIFCFKFLIIFGKFRTGRYVLEVVKTVDCIWNSYRIYSKVFLESLLFYPMHLHRLRKNTNLTLFYRIFCSVLFCWLSVGLFFSVRSLSVYPWLSWNSIHSPDWPSMQRSTWICLPRTGIKGTHHHCLAYSIES